MILAVNETDGKWRYESVT